MNVAEVVNKILGKKLETKMSCFSSTNYIQVEHHSFVSIDNVLLKTTQGTVDQMNSDTPNRIGYEITLKGVSMKFMFELNE